MTRKVHSAAAARSVSFNASASRIACASFSCYKNYRQPRYLVATVAARSFFSFIRYVYGLLVERFDEAVERKLLLVLVLVPQVLNPRERGVEPAVHRVRRRSRRAASEGWHFSPRDFAFITRFS